MQAGHAAALLAVLLLFAIICSRARVERGQGFPATYFLISLLPLTAAHEHEEEREDGRAPLRWIPLPQLRAPAVRYTAPPHRGIFNSLRSATGPRTAALSLLTFPTSSPPHLASSLSIVRAFLIEEQKIVKRMVKNQPAAAAAAAPAKKATKAAKK